MIELVQQYITRELVKLKPGKTAMASYEFCDIEAPAGASGTIQLVLDLAAAHDCDVTFDDYYRRAEFRRKTSVA